MKFELHGAIWIEIKSNFPTLELDSQNVASNENSQPCIYKKNTKQRFEFPFPYIICTQVIDKPLLWVLGHPVMYKRSLVLRVGSTIAHSQFPS